LNRKNSPNRKGLTWTGRRRHKMHLAATLPRRAEESVKTDDERDAASAAFWTAASFVLAILSS
jgi:hypothetical protein